MIKKPLKFGELVGPLVLFKPDEGGRGILVPKRNSLAFLNALHLTSPWTVEGLVRKRLVSCGMKWRECLGDWL